LFFYPFKVVHAVTLPNFFLGLNPFGAFVFKQEQGGLAVTVFLKLWQAGPEQFEELQGIDWNWYANKRARTKLPWGGRKTNKSPTSGGKTGRKRRQLSFGHEVPVALATEEANRQEMKRVQPTPDAIGIEPVSAIPAPQQPRMSQANSLDSDEKQGLLHELDFPA
jgi:hypothetical protein